MDTHKSDSSKEGSSNSLETVEVCFDDLLFDSALSLDLVSAFAGDRPLLDREKCQIEEYRKNRETKFYSDLLYAVTHQYFPNPDAETLWNQILRHKFDMSTIMKRNIRITVATLDYLSNLKGELHSPTVIDEARIAEIVQQTRRDGLTRLYNHATCYQKIEAELKRFERYGTIFSLMMMDIDNFKKINDRYGHPEGDRILAILGGIITRETRDSDISCRYGGEEFSVILPSTEIKEAFILAERLRGIVEYTVPFGKKVTISIGVASCRTGADSAHSLVAKADSALYHAKRSGRNRVVTITEMGSFKEVARERIL
jgi:diguanylate cyclase (GGDEF)-like protein